MPSGQHLPRFFTRRGVHILGLALAVALAYGNILSNTFVWDDRDYLVNWQSVKSLDHIGELLGGDNPHAGSYRPLTSIYYALSVTAYGDNVFGYHCNKIALHILASILCYLIFLHLSKSTFLSLGGALFFALHPIHAEVVTSMTSAYDLSAVFLLGSVLLFFYFDGRQTLPRARWEARFWLTYLGSLALALLAYFSYELTLALPFLLASYVVLFPGRPSGDGDAAARRARYLLLVPYFLGVALSAKMLETSRHPLNRVGRRGET